MRNEPASDADEGQEGRQPIFLLPAGVTLLAGLIIAVHLGMTFVLDDAGRQAFTIWFAFIPSRTYYLDAGGWMPHLWTPFTHAFLHAGFDHLLINMAWLVIFATPVARRYGTFRTTLLFLLSSAVGAAAFALTSINSPDAPQILVGASGGVAGLTGAAVRFMFQPVIFGEDRETGERIALGRHIATIPQLFTEGRVRNFILIWVVLNAAVPLLPALTGGNAVLVAWQAHLGGFLAGLLLVGLFERRGH